ncbi:hypothetical protein [Sporomusa aerivorans]|uniref:hypothetical protein n=1 Tax=Sporomusa aerivorans TaxID=204936 RepID=UPI00352B0C1C
MEPISTAAVIVEKAAEVTLANEVSKEAMLEAQRLVNESSGINEIQCSEQQMENFYNLIENEARFQKLNDLKELGRMNPEAARAEFNRTIANNKGDIGEALSESILSDSGPINRQIRVEGVDKANIVDIQLDQANSPVVLKEVNIYDGKVILENNYDIVEGETASFEIKNGSFTYLQNEINGNLKSQITAGKKLSDHSFVGINEDAFMEMKNDVATTENVLKKIHEADGKLVVMLPESSIQLAMILC